MMEKNLKIERKEVVEEKIQKEGKRKWMLRFKKRGDGRKVEIERVYIKEEGRGKI